MTFGMASAHEMTPAYPELKPSQYGGVLVAELRFFNRREDVEYYELSVHDENWRPVRFVSSERIWHAPYLSRKQLDVYIHKMDIERVTYICTTSKIFKSEKIEPTISSKICSKIKRE